MNSITLSAKELIVLASYLGADTFHGLKDPFYGMTKTEILGEIPEIQMQIERRSYASLGFDDSFTVLPDVVDIISTCIFCESYLMVDAILYGEVHPKTMIYMKDGKIVLMKIIGEDIEIKRVTAEECEDILSISTETTKQVDSNEVFLDYDLFHAIKGRPKDEIVLQLKSVGCSDKMANLLTDGLTKQCYYKAISFVNCVNRKSISVSFIYADDSILKLSMTENSLTRWSAKLVSNEQMAKEITMINNTFLSLEGSEISAGA